MASIILLELTPTINVKKDVFLQTIQQYFTSEGFQITEDHKKNIILIHSMVNISQTKLAPYINTIKNTSNFNTSIKSLYSTTSLNKV